MLRSMQDLKDYTIAAIDGDIGEVKDFYFDNEAWVIRSFIVETSAWVMPPHLRSCKAIIGYHIKATDGAVGHIESLLINEETWAIQYLVINTSNWWIGHKVLIAPEWIDEISWADRSVTVDLDCASIKASPPYESSQQLNRERESNLYKH